MLILQLPKFWEVCQLQDPISLQKSTKLTKSYSGQTVPIISYATLTFSYDPDGQFIFPLTVWITEMKTQNLLGKDSYQKQVSGIHFHLPGVETKNPPKSICYGSFHQNKWYPHLSQIVTIRTPYTMYIDAKVPVAGNIHPQTHIYTSRQAVLFNRIQLLWLLACPLSALYALDLNVTFRY